MDGKRVIVKDGEMLKVNIQIVLILQILQILQMEKIHIKADTIWALRQEWKRQNDIE